MISDILKHTLIIGCGSFAGGALRYLIGLAMKGISKGFPWATLLVNLLGCLLIGLLWGYFSRTATEGSSASLFLTIGLCGGFTTFSTFSKEALTMLQCSNYFGFASYLIISILAGIGLVALGYVLTK